MTRMMSVHLRRSATLFPTTSAGCSYLFVKGTATTHSWRQVHEALFDVGAVAQTRIWGHRANSDVVEFRHTGTFSDVESECFAAGSDLLLESMKFPFQARLSGQNFPDEHSALFFLTSPTLLETLPDGTCVWHVETGASAKKVRAAVKVLRANDLATDRKVDPPTGRALVVPDPDVRLDVASLARTLPLVVLLAVLLVVATVVAALTGGDLVLACLVAAVGVAAVAGVGTRCVRSVQRRGRTVTSTSHARDITALGRALAQTKGPTAMDRRRIVWEASQSPEQARALLASAVRLRDVLAEERAAEQHLSDVQLGVLDRAVVDAEDRLASRRAALAEIKERDARI